MMFIQCFEYVQACDTKWFCFVCQYWTTLWFVIVLFQLCLKIIMLILPQMEWYCARGETTEDLQRTDKFTGRMHPSRLENISRKALLWDLKSPFTCLVFSFLIWIKGPLIRTCVISTTQYLSFRHVCCIHIQLCKCWEIWLGGSSETNLEMKTYMDSLCK